MAQNIGISIEEFESLSKKLQNLKEQIDLEMKSISSTAEEMQVKWQGKASEDFHTAITTWQTNNMKNFDEIMSNYLTKLANYKEQMITLDNTSF